MYPKPVLYNSSLRVLTNFRISGVLLATRNSFLTIHLVPLTRSLTIFYNTTKHLAPLVFSARFPFCCSICCLPWASYGFLTKSSLSYINNLPSPFNTPIIQPHVTSSKPKLFLTYHVLASTLTFILGIQTKQLSVLLNVSLPFTFVLSFFLYSNLLNILALTLNK